MDFNSRLIDLVSARDPLYNQFNALHKNSELLQRYWTEIASQLDCTAEQCKKRWTSLRTTYGKKHKEVKSVPSGSAVATMRWPYYRQMGFMDGFIKHREGVDNLPPGIPELSECDEAIILEESTHGTSGTNSVLESDDAGESPSSATQSAPSSFAAQPNSFRSTSQPAIPAYGKRKTTDRAQVHTEMAKFLKKTTEELDKKMDKYDHFGHLVAAQLRLKTNEEADMYIKVISNVLFSPIENIVQE